MLKGKKFFCVAFLLLFLDPKCPLVVVGVHNSKQGRVVGETLAVFLAPQCHFQLTKVLILPHGLFKNNDLILVQLVWFSNYWKSNSLFHMKSSTFSKIVDTSYIFKK